MRILLIFPPDENITLTSQPLFVVGSKGALPPLGLVYLATSIRDSTDHDVKILDCQLHANPREAVFNEVLSYRPHVVGISITTHVLRDSMGVIRTVRSAAGRLKNEVVLVVGGPHVTVFPDVAPQMEGVDYALAGEAEYTFIDLINRLGDNRAISQIPGASFMSNGELVMGPPRQLIKNLDSVPIPDRRLLDYKKYGYLLGDGKIVTTVMSSRGCPYKCIYCDRMGKTFRPASAEYVIRELEDCVDLGIGEFFFYDDTFTVQKKRVLEICTGIIKKGWRIRLACRSRVDVIDEELIVAMKKAGWHRISFGVEAGTQHIIKRIKKDIKLDQAKKAFALARKHGLTTLADFMLGHPDETIEDIKQTINFARELDPDYVQFNVTTPYPATELYTEALEKGIIPYDVWREFAFRPTDDFRPPRWDQNISVEELENMVHKAYRSFYMRPKFILREIKNTSSLKSFNRKAKAGFWMISHEILRKFRGAHGGLR